MAAQGQIRGGGGGGGKGKRVYRSAIEEYIKAIRMDPKQGVRQYEPPSDLLRMARNFASWAPNVSAAEDRQLVRFKGSMYHCKYYRLLIEDARSRNILVIDGTAFELIDGWQLATKALFRYALNLYLTPTRLEFRRVKVKGESITSADETMKINSVLTNSYYMYNVDGKLRNAKEILVAMGYEPVVAASGSIQELNYKGDVDKERVITMATDLIVLFGELEIVKNIANEIVAGRIETSQLQSITLEDILTIRSRDVVKLDNVYSHLVRLTFQQKASQQQQPPSDQLHAPEPSFARQLSDGSQRSDDHLQVADPLRRASAPDYQFQADAGLDDWHYPSQQSTPPILQTGPAPPHHGQGQRTPPVSRPAPPHEPHGRPTPPYTHGDPGQPNSAYPYTVPEQLTADYSHGAPARPTAAYAHGLSGQPTCTSPYSHGTPAVTYSHAAASQNVATYGQPTYTRGPPSQPATTYTQGTPSQAVPTYTHDAPSPAATTSHTAATYAQVAATRVAVTQPSAAPRGTLASSGQIDHQRHYSNTPGPSQAGVGHEPLAHNRLRDPQIYEDRQMHEGEKAQVVDHSRAATQHGGNPDMRKHGLQPSRNDDSMFETAAPQVRLDESIHNQPVHVDKSLPREGTQHYHNLPHRLGDTAGDQSAYLARMQSDSTHDTIPSSASAVECRNDRNFQLSGEQPTREYDTRYDNVSDSIEGPGNFYYNADVVHRSASTSSGEMSLSKERKPLLPKTGRTKADSLEREQHLQELYARFPHLVSDSQGEDSLMYGDGRNSFRQELETTNEQEEGSVLSNSVLQNLPAPLARTREDIGKVAMEPSASSASFLSMDLEIKNAHSVFDDDYGGPNISLMSRPLPLDAKSPELQRNEADLKKWEMDMSGPPSLTCETERSPPDSMEKKDRSETHLMYDGPSVDESKEEEHGEGFPAKPPLPQGLKVVESEKPVPHPRSKGMIVTRSKTMDEPKRERTRPPPKSNSASKLVEASGRADQGDAYNLKSMETQARDIDEPTTPSPRTSTPLSKSSPKPRTRQNVPHTSPSMRDDRLSNVKPATTPATLPLTRHKDPRYGKSQPTIGDSSVEATHPEVTKTQTAKSYAEKLGYAYVETPVSFEQKYWVCAYCTNLVKEPLMTCDVCHKDKHQKD